MSRSAGTLNSAAAWAKAASSSYGVRSASRWVGVRESSTAAGAGVDVGSCGPQAARESAAAAAATSGLRNGCISTP